MDPLHLHLMLNHFPIVGPWLALPLFGLALALRAERGFFLSATVVLATSAILGLAAERSGEAAEHDIEERALTGFEADFIEVHEHRAEGAVAVLFAAAILATVATVYERSGNHRVPSWMVLAVMVLTLASALAMAWTAQAGGWIRHPELRPAAQVR